MSYSSLILVILLSNVFYIHTHDADHTFAIGTALQPDKTECLTCMPDSAYEHYYVDTTITIEHVGLAYYTQEHDAASSLLIKKFCNVITCKHALSSTLHITALHPGKVKLTLKYVSGEERTYFLHIIARPVTVTCK